MDNKARFDRVAAKQDAQLQGQTQMLGKILGAENLSISYVPNIETASFDMRTRSIRMPIYNKKMRDVTHQYLVAHEVSHALFTPMISDQKEWDNKLLSIGPNKEAAMACWNIAEDIRVERKMLAKFPGLLKTFVGGAADLASMGLLPNQDIPQTAMHFPGRLNTAAKMRGMIAVEFSDEEMKVVEQAYRTETLGDTLALAKILYESLTEQQQEQMAQSVTDTSAPGGIGDEFDADGGGEEADADVEGGQSNGKGKDPFETSDAGSRLAGLYGSLNPIPSAHMEFKDPQTEMPKKKDAYATGCPEATFTDYDLSKIVTPVDDVVSETRRAIGNSWGNLENDANNWFMQQKPIISYMASIFERKKNAKINRHQNVAKTGKLATQMLSMYKLSDDIFQKRTTVLEGKDHGFVILLDMSGSMAERMDSTVQQILNLILFAERIGCPIEVYGFHQRNRHPIKRVTGNLEGYDACGLNCFYDSSTSRHSRREAKYALYALSRYSDRSKGYTSAGGVRCPMFDLCGTPLYSSVFQITKVMERFKARYGLERNNLIVMTDGEAGDSGNTVKTGLRSEGVLQFDLNINGRKYRWDSNHEDIYNFYMRTIADGMQIATIGMFLTSSPGVRHGGKRYGSAPEHVKTWNEKGYYEIKDGGYTANFIVKDTRVTNKGEITDRQRERVVLGRVVEILSQH